MAHVRALNNLTYLIEKPKIVGGILTEQTPNGS